MSFGTSRASLHTIVSGAMTSDHQSMDALSVLRHVKCHVRRGQCVASPQIVSISRLCSQRYRHPQRMKRRRLLSAEKRQVLELCQSFAPLHLCQWSCDLFRPMENLSTSCLKNRLNNEERIRRSDPSGKIAALSDIYIDIRVLQWCSQRKSAREPTRPLWATDGFGLHLSLEGGLRQGSTLISSNIEL